MDKRTEKNTKCRRRLFREKKIKGGAVQEEGQKPGLYLSLASPRPL